MINSSKTEYAFWKLKILEPGRGQERCGPASVTRSLKPTSLIHRPKRGKQREIEGQVLGWSCGREEDSHSRNTGPRLRHNDGRSPAPRARCLPLRFHTRRKAKRIACRRPYYLETRERSLSNCDTRHKMQHRASEGKHQRDPRTLVFQEITHLSSPRKYELRHIFDDLGFGFL